MSLTEACGWSLLRSLLIAFLSLPLCCGLNRFLAGLRGFPRRLAWWALVVPFLFPGQLTSYAYANFSLSLIHHPFWNEVLYGLLLSMTLVPVGTILLRFAPPPPLSAEAAYCRRLSWRTGDIGWSRLKILTGDWLHGALRTHLPAFAVIFLLAFQEFEIVSLMNATSWTIWLFDAQAGGLMLSESLRLVMIPLTCTAAVLAPIVWLVLTTHRLPSADERPHLASSSTTKALLIGYLLGALAVTVFVPLMIVSQGVADGLAFLGSNRIQLRGLSKEIATGIGFGGITALLAWLGADRLLAKTKRPTGPPHPHSDIPTEINPGSGEEGETHTLRTLALFAMSLPGLCGTLVLSLLLLFAFQLPGLRALYNTPLPVVLGLTLFLLPRALLVCLLLKALRDPAAAHLADLLLQSPAGVHRARGRELHWWLTVRGQVYAAALFFWWAYLDLTVTYVLAPPWLVTAPVRLYNQMHFGRNDVLSAMMLVTVAVPIVLFVILVEMSFRLSAFGSVGWRPRTNLQN